MLNKNEIKKLVSLLKKIDQPHEGLPQPVFNVLCKVVPFIACELVIATKEGILLTWREDKWWRGWHFPGGLLRYGESFEERIQRTAWAELGIQIKSFKFLFPKNYIESRRGHTVSLVFLCKIDAKPSCGRFFKKMPKNIIDGHQGLWGDIKDIIN